MAAVAVTILASHLWQWLNAQLVEVEQGTYTQFVVWPIILGSAVALIGILVAAVMLQCYRSPGQPSLAWSFRASRWLPGRSYGDSTNLRSGAARTLHSPL